MNRLRLATSATLLGVVLAAGCASPCGSCGGVFQRMSMFRARRACPGECCSSCGGGGPVVGGDWGDGPILETPGGPPLTALPPPGGMAAPGPFAPSLGAPLGTPAVPTEPGRLNPVPNGAQPFEAGPSSRVGRR